MHLRWGERKSSVRYVRKAVTISDPDQIKCRFQDFESAIDIAHLWRFARRVLFGWKILRAFLLKRRAYPLSICRSQSISAKTEERGESAYPPHAAAVG
ncbi:hypothetical protein [uncultured Roseobacter sp.]|uniref:hypothetical protein n=1 Tax=uncultured Roseobacter sp. TaxID=114847 RepID=UPI00260581F1|nr:hypothetical protein [uncultured Roseobacter sp.]